ncbi:MAG: hypothetical protein CSA29_04030 [Desulfobacterales bacterium]|nr:MAG: hypothetical protein CSA29_04030 [Desulfobacterales bacterium]
MKIGIIVEMENGTVKDTNFGMITLARKNETATLTALVLDGVDAACKTALEQYGINSVADIRLPQADAVRLNPDVRARALVNIAKTLKLNSILGLSTAEGKDLIPRVAALIDAPLVMDCMNVDLSKGMVWTSQYSGKVLADIKLTADVTVMGIQPNAVAPSPAPGTAELLTMDQTTIVPSGLELVSWDQGAGNAELPSLSEADIIVAGGRGVQGKENFQLLFDCAKKLNAAVGASRVAVDENWIPYAHQVGQTGEKVSPAIYLALGISGSVQHFAGMKTSGTIIAVNTDENAAMMANADYYVNADLFDVLPELIRQLG